jgi:hypothetical protein
MLRGSRYLRLRGLSLTLNQVPQALLSIWASQNSKDQEKLTDGRTLCPLPECFLNSHYHKHSDKRNTPFTVSQLHQSRLCQHPAWGRAPPVSSYVFPYLSIYLFIFALIKRCITFRKPNKCFLLYLYVSIWSLSLLNN